MISSRQTKKKKVVTHRIPFDHWINSHLSIARHFGGCELNGKHYVLDPDQMKEPNADGKFKPDLITYDL